MPQTQEEALLDAVSRRLRGRTERLEAFAQAEVERSATWNGCTT